MRFKFLIIPSVLEFSVFMLRLFWLRIKLYSAANSYSISKMESFIIAQKKQAESRKLKCAWYKISFFLMCLPLFAAAEVPFQAGKDYRVLPPAQQIQSASTEVIEFFSYGCPACYHLEPTIEKWLAQKPKQLVFKRVPVVFHRGWDVYAKAYYIAEAFKLEPKLTPKLFAAVQQENLNLTNEQALGQFFSKEGISRQDFKDAFESSSALAIKLKQAEEMMRQYNIIEIPSFIINGKFYTNAAMAKGDPDRLIQIINFLLNKKEAK